MTSNQIHTVARGYAFLECPRWHAGRLWVSDMHQGRIVALSEDGQVEQTLLIPGRPGGLGWLPDGTLLAVSTTDRRIVRYQDGEVTTHADLSDIGVTEHDLNDMVVDWSGRCYVGESAVDIYSWMAEHMPGVAEGGVGILGQAPIPEATVFLVDPDGSVRDAASGLRFPNGGAIDRTRNRYILAETFGMRLSVFEIDEGGGLSQHRVIDLGFCPDGVSGVDREGGVWVADPLGLSVHRIDVDGHKTDSVTFELPVYSCELGGHDGRTLFACLASTVDPEQTVQLLHARVDAVRVSVPAAQE